MRLKNLKSLIPMTGILLFLMSMLILGAKPAAAANFFGALQTSLPSGTIPNGNLYPSKDAVYLTGGPQNLNAAGLPNGEYYFQVTDPNGNELYSTDPALCRQVRIIAGAFAGTVNTTNNSLWTGNPVTGGGCQHATSPTNVANDSVPVQLGIPTNWFDTTTNPGGEYKAWLIAKTGTIAGCTTTVNGDGIHLIFASNCAKTDNFKVKGPTDYSCKDDPFQPKCVVRMPISKYVEGRPTVADPANPSCPFTSITTGPDINGVTTTTVTTTCQDTPKVIGTWTQVCTTTTPPGTTSCATPVVAYLPQFTAGLWANDTTGQPAGFPGGALGTVTIPLGPSDPFFPAGVPAVGCETDIPQGWYLPDNGVTLIGAGGAGAGTFTPPVFTPTAGTGSLISAVINAAGTGYTAGDIVTVAGGTGGTVQILTAPGGVPTSVVVLTYGTGYSHATAALTSYGGLGTGLTLHTTVGNDRNRCFDFTIPADPTTGLPTVTLFEMHLNNVPAGNIVVTKTSHGKTGTFTFTTTGGGDCNVHDNNTSPSASNGFGDICTGFPTSADPGSFTLNTGTSNPNSQSSTVDARVFPYAGDPHAIPLYSVSETGAPGGLSAWNTTVSCTGNDGGAIPTATLGPPIPHSALNTGFGVRPYETVTCAFVNYLKACSYTQGAWFAKASGNNPASLLASASIFPLNTGVSRYVQFTAASKLSAAKPGGTPGVLGSSSPYVNPANFANTGSGNFGSQVVALQINLMMGDAGKLTYAGIGDFILGNLTGPDACFNGMKVRDLLTNALEPVLGGNLALSNISGGACGVGNTYTSLGGNIGTLTGLLGGDSGTGTLKTGINPSYDQCVQSDWALQHLF